MEWHSDPEQLVSVLRRTPTHWGQVPEIDGYHEVVELDRGGQGVVYRARQRALNRTVAIKVLPEGRLASEASRYRFQREVELAARLRHPHIVRVHDSGVTEEGFPFYVMDYVEGRPLVPGLQRPLELFGKICDAVEHAHQRGIIHRDLKPANILIDESSSPHILDFGIAKSALEDEDVTPLSRTGQFLGSLPWASPEQVEMSPDGIDVRTDVYSLGVILYQLVTGRLPHEESGNLRLLLEGIVGTPPPRPRTLCPDLPGDVETIILTCLAKDPSRRYQTVSELSGDLRRYLAGRPIDAKRDRTWYVLRKLVARHKAVTSLVSLMVVLVLGFAATMSFLYQDVSESETTARRSLEKAQAVRAFLQDMIDLSDPCRSPETARAVGNMLDEAVLTVGDRFGSSPEVEAEIRHMLGTAYWHLSRLDEAEAQERAALALLETSPGELHAEIAEVLLCLGHIAISRRRLEESESILERARGLLTDADGDHGVLAARCWLHLAELRWAQRRPQEAESLFRRAHALYADRPGEDDMFMLKTLIKWSNMLITEQAVHGELEALGEAVRRLEEAQSILDDHPGENLWAGCLVKLHLGRAMLASGDHEYAATLFQEADGCSRAVYGPAHSLIADIANLKGDVHFRRREYAEAEEMYSHALALHDASGEERHLGRAWTLWNLSQTRWARDDAEGAESALREAVTAYLEGPAPERLPLPDLVSRLERLRREQGRRNEAQILAEQALRLR